MLERISVLGLHSGYSGSSATVCERHWAPWGRRDEGGPVPDQDPPAPRPALSPSYRQRGQEETDQEPPSFDLQAISPREGLPGDKRRAAALGPGPWVCAPAWPLPGSETQPCHQHLCGRRVRAPLTGLLQPCSSLRSRPDSAEPGPGTCKPIERAPACLQFPPTCAAPSCLLPALEEVGGEPGAGGSSHPPLLPQI